METFQAVLLSVWQEACRHIEIGQSTSTIARLLVRDMPIDLVLVRQIDPERACLETLAAESLSAAAPPGQVRSACSAEEIQQIQAWCRRGEVAHGLASGGHIPLARAIPEDRSRDLLVGPLGDAGGLGGLLVLVARAGHVFDSRHAQLAQVLLDPFSVALENDRRLCEVKALREAAEADRRSLLTKLGRKNLGDAIVGAESGLQEVMQRVELVARSDVPVLIFGETGTGKELLARAIHNRSSRSAGPIHRVNCGAIPPELIDSELFGHEKGAFTGADQLRKGWFERADGGTLFLDEIGELPLAAQVRLLRILQDGWLERVGGHQPIHVDVRIVAATHRDLANMVSQGSFRQDLWYRLAVFPIMLPPLRERRGDIPEMACHFAERAAIRFGLPVVMPSADDIALLMAYPWPGNVRELGAVIDRAAILGNGRCLEVATALGVAGPALSAAPGAPASPAYPPSPGEIVTLDEAMRRHIELALGATSGQIEGSQGAAALLGINPHTLRARMRKLGVEWSRYRKK